MSVAIKSSASLKQLIANEKRELVRECFREVWEELSLEDIEPDMIAEVFIDSALKRLISERGGQEASKLIAHFKELDEIGFLPGRHTLQ